MHEKPEHDQPHQAGSDTKAAIRAFPTANEVRPATGTLVLESVRIVTDSDALSGEAAVFAESLAERGIAVSDTGIPVHVSTGTLNLPVRASRHRARLIDDGYELDITPQGVAVRAESGAGAFHGLMSLLRAIAPDGSLPCASIRDWPDLPTRMIMVDPARQNENLDYYRRVIRVAARYGVNAILVHITDDQNACLFHPDYPELMHAHAWKPEEIRELVAFARRHHVELIPEVESFGHSQLFTRRADHADFLHEESPEGRTGIWGGTDIPGFTNVLCPAKERTYEYLDRMYAAAAGGFDAPLLHLGFDEVDMSTCPKCAERFPGATRAEWFRNHMLRCRDLALRHAPAVAYWGDMLLEFPEIMDGLPTGGTVIYDWHYLPDVSPESAALFDARGFAVIACPALVCYPYMVLPATAAYDNIRNFAAIAGRLDLAGLNTTIWLPQRYMSDVLWPGIAFAGAQAWCGGEADDDALLAQAAADLFGVAEGPRFAAAWKALAALVGNRDELELCAWADADALNKAATAAEERRDDTARRRTLLIALRAELDAMAPGVRRNHDAWHTIGRSADIVRYLLDRLDAAADPNPASPENVRDLDARCREIIGWIEEDWNRNRHPGDPNLDGIHLPQQHLLHHFRQMHRFHERLLAENGG